MRYLPKRQKQLCLYIRDHRDPDGYCHIPLSRLGKRFGVTISTIYEALQTLAKKGFIEVCKSPISNVNLYRFLK